MGGDFDLESCIQMPGKLPKYSIFPAKCFPRDSSRYPIHLNPTPNIAAIIVEVVSVVSS